MFTVGKKFSAAMIAGGLLAAMPLSSYGLVTLSDGANTLDFDEDTTTITSWVVGGVNHVGSATVFGSPAGVVYGALLGGFIVPFDDIFGTPTIRTFDNPFDMNTYKLEATYDSPGVSGISLVMTIDITGGLNTSLVNVNFAIESDREVSGLLFELSNMDLNGTPGGDVLVTGTPEMLDIRDGGTQFQQNWLGTNGTPLEDPFFNFGFLPPADLFTAYGWEFSFVPGTTQTTGNLTIQKVLTVGPDRNVIPEPVTAFLSLLGLGAVAGKLTTRKSR